MTHVLVLKLLILALSIAVIYLLIEVRAWRDRTAAANRKRKEVEEDAKRDLAELISVRDVREAKLVSAYEARGDTLKRTAQLRADTEELRQRAIDKIVQLQRERSADAVAIAGFAEVIANRDLAIVATTKEREEAEAKLVDVVERLRVSDLDVARLTRQLSESTNVQDYYRKLADGRVRAASIVERIENLPAETESLTGERFRLVKFRAKTNRWVLGGGVSPKKVARDLSRSRRRAA